MTQATDTRLIERLRKMAVCIYIAVEASVADDIADGLKTSASRIESLRAEVARKDEALEAIANWRENSFAYTDSMNLPRRKMDEAQVLHMQAEARTALGDHQ